MDFDPQIVKNVIDTETGRTWDCTLVGKVGELGCFQIRPEMHDVDPLDFEASTRYFVTTYKAGYGYLWVSCNCYGFVSLSVDLPRMASIVPNTAPVVGAVAIFQYPEKHIAIVEKLTETGFIVREANKEPCKISTREVQWNDPKLVGFFSAPIVEMGDP